jgi:hypothetical protein
MEQFSGSIFEIYWHVVLMLGQISVVISGLVTLDRESAFQASVTALKNPSGASHYWQTIRIDDLKI